MNDLIQTVDSAEEITRTAVRLRAAVLLREQPLRVVLELFERWAGALSEAVAGAAFLRLWLRQGTLQPILERELGQNVLDGGWRDDGRAKLRAFPVGVVGHWPAGNIEIQPVLSLTCALLGGNGSLVRVPSGLIGPTHQLMETLRSVDADGLLTERIALVSFDHARDDLQEAMARNVDGAMIWGGAEAVARVRALPFPHWARLAVFGPRLSVAARDASVWDEPAERSSWCQRLARTSGNSTNRRVPLRKSYSSNAAPARTSSRLSRSLEALSRQRTARTRALKSTLPSRPPSAWPAPRGCLTTSPIKPGFPRRLTGPFCLAKTQTSPNRHKVAP